jgi:hypothetical protein
VLYVTSTFRITLTFECHLPTGLAATLNKHKVSRKYEYGITLFDQWKEALSRISVHSGYRACRAPSYTSVGVAAVKRQGRRADTEVTLPLSHGPTLLDMSMIHPRCPTYVAATTQTLGMAADLRDMSKERAHSGHLDPSHTFVPASLERYGHIGRPIMQYLRTLRDTASVRSLAVTLGSFLASAHRELSVAHV